MDEEKKETTNPYLWFVRPSAGRYEVYDAGSPGQDVIQTFDYRTDAHQFLWQERQIWLAKHPPILLLPRPTDITEYD